MRQRHQAGTPGVVLNFPPFQGTGARSRLRKYFESAPILRRLVMAIDVEALKGHLNKTASEVDAIDAAVLPRLVSAATAHTERQLGYALTDTTELPAGAPADLEHAVLMLAAWWYDQRESSLVGVTAQTVPHGYDDIIREHRTYTFGVVDDV